MTTLSCWLALAMASVGADATPAPATAKDALKAFNLVVGSWKGTGTQEAVRPAKEKTFWNETIAWEWQFKGDDVWLKATIDKGKFYTQGELRYLVDKKAYQLIAKTAEGDSVTFAGTVAIGKTKETILTLERTDDKTKETERLVFTLLHHNRYLYRLETKAEGATTFVRKYQVGATKDGVAFADVPMGPECIVSGGRGSTTVSHNGKTYYVCCSGCRDAFKDEPEKYIKEFEAKSKK